LRDEKGLQRTGATRYSLATTSSMVWAAPLMVWAVRIQMGLDQPSGVCGGALCFVLCWGSRGWFGGRLSGERGSAGSLFLVLCGGNGAWHGPIKSGCGAKRVLYPVLVPRFGLPRPARTKTSRHPEGVALNQPGVKLGPPRWGSRQPRYPVQRVRVPRVSRCSLRSHRSTLG
jgi:hypothetical protein